MSSEPASHYDDQDPATSSALSDSLPASSAKERSDTFNRQQITVGAPRALFPHLFTSAASQTARDWGASRGTPGPSVGSIPVEWHYPSASGTTSEGRVPGERPIRAHGLRGKEAAAERKRWRKAAWDTLYERGARPWSSAVRLDYIADQNLTSMLDLTEDTFQADGTCDPRLKRWDIRLEVGVTFYQNKLAGRLSTDEYVLIPI